MHETLRFKVQAFSHVESCSRVPSKRTLSVHTGTQIHELDIFMCGLVPPPMILRD